VALGLCRLFLEAPWKNRAVQVSAYPGYINNTFNIQYTTHKLCEIHKIRTNTGGGKILKKYLKNSVRKRCKGLMKKNGSKYKAE
jgi:hypothetical protein